MMLIYFNKMTENKRKPMNYQNGKIYKIVCNITNKIYVGSTCKPRLCDRLGQHRAMYKRYLSGISESRYTSFDILKGGDYSIVLLELCPCESKEELLKKEREYIEKLDCVNKFIPGRTMQEWMNDNKEKIKEKNKVYWENNKEKLSEKYKVYRKNNKEKLSEKNKEYLKEYRVNNKEKIKEKAKEKIKCVCGVEIVRSTIKRHVRTKKHLKLMEKLE